VTVNRTSATNEGPPIVPASAGDRDAPRLCTATTKAGRPCRAYAVKGSHPPRCPAHGGGSRPLGAAPGNQNARTHGLDARGLPPVPPDGAIPGSSSDSTQEAAPPSLSGRISQLDRKIQHLSDYIYRRLQETDGLTPEQYAVLLSLYGQLVSRLGRLMRDQRALSGQAADSIAGALAQALDELSTELGTDL
jgi:hypothetical protein